MITPAFSLIGLPAGSLRSDAYGAAYSGSPIVGTATLSAGGTKAYTFDGVSFTLLSAAGAPGSTTASAVAVSDDGTVVVGVDEDKACIWESGVRTSLGSFDGVRASQANACSSDGSVVVGWSAGYIPAVPNTKRPFKWTSGGGMVLVPVLAGVTNFDDESASLISADGSTIAGRYWTWTSAGGTVASPSATVASSTTVELIAISETGSILAGNEYPTAGGNYPVRCVNGSASRISMDVADPTGLVLGMTRDGSCIYWTSTDGTTYRWTLAGGNEEVDFDLSLYTWSTGSQAVSGDGTVLVGVDESTTDEGCYLLFDAPPDGEFFWTAYVNTGETLL